MDRVPGFRLLLRVTQGREPLQIEPVVKGGSDGFPDSVGPPKLDSIGIEPESPEGFVTFSGSISGSCGLSEETLGGFDSPASGEVREPLILFFTSSM